MQEKGMISVSQELLNGLYSKMQNLEDHVRALEAVNRELTQAINEKEYES